MKLWMSGEVDSDVGDAFRITMNYVESQVNENIKFQEYGEVLNTWDVIMIISAEAGKETFRYNKKTAEYSVRMIIPHKDFKDGPRSRQIELFVVNLLRSLDHLASKGVHQNFSFRDLGRDILTLFKNNNDF